MADHRGTKRGRRQRDATAAAAILVGGIVAAAVLPAGAGSGAERLSGAASRASAVATAGLPARDKAAAHRPVAGPPAVEAGLLPWQLQAPISREAVLPEAGANALLIAGGLTANGTSGSGIYRLDTATGGLTLVGDLPQATHDVAATVVGNTGLVFGGGTVAPASTTEGVSPTGTARALSPLPVPRADAAAVTIGGTAYIVGGYNGPSFDPGVLATKGGEGYRVVARLAVPVRYPAVAAMNGRIYVFGGLAGDGHPVSAVQMVNPATGTARVIGQLQVAVSGSAAGVLGGTIYLAGGASATGPVTGIFAFDPASSRCLLAGSLPVAVANAGASVSGGRLFVVGGETAGGSPTAYVQVVRADRKFGVAGAPGAGSPFYGEKLLIADRGNDRLLLLDDTGRVIWTYPSPAAPAPPGGFYFPDDAFFIRHGTAIISNQEGNETVIEIAYPSGRVTFSYGHPGVAGSAPGYLNNPDDAYLLRNGDIAVADPKNCRALIIDPASRKVLHQIGTTGSCAHNPPYGLGSPNGDTPLADGNLLISEINGSWVDEYTPDGHLVWDVQLPIGYPSDPQQVGPDRYLVADYENPGAIVEFNRAGRVLYRYQPVSGPGELNRPSLVELLPSGVFLLNDDYNDRVVAIDPSTGAVVWQYGQTGAAGTAAGQLNIPDGFDILGRGGTTPTHPATG